MTPYDDPHVSAGEIADYLHSQQKPMPDLLPCPWCGVTPELQPCLRHGFFITCENHHCPVEPQTLHDFETPQQAAEAWNNRPGPVFEPAVIVLEEKPQQLMSPQMSL